MVGTTTNGQYEVLSPWAEADPKELKGISPRPTDLEGKKIGLFSNIKMAAPRIQTVLAEKLKTRFPTVQISHFLDPHNREIAGTDAEARFRQWAKESDAVITAVGD